MAVAENSVEKGKAMWGKLDVVQGFLIYKIGILTSDDIDKESLKAISRVANVKVKSGLFGGGIISDKRYAVSYTHLTLPTTPYV